jgi:hypothetical protein
MPDHVVMAVTAELLLRRVTQGALNGLPLIGYHWRGDRQPWQVRLRDKILAEVAADGEVPDVVLPQRQSRRSA